MQYNFINSPLIFNLYLTLFLFQYLFNNQFLHQSPQMLQTINPNNQLFGFQGILKNSVARLDKQPDYSSLAAQLQDKGYLQNNMMQDSAVGYFIAQGNDFYRQSKFLKIQDQTTKETNKTQNKRKSKIKKYNLHKLQEQYKQLFQSEDNYSTQQLQQKLGTIIQNSKRFQKDLNHPAKIAEEKMIEQINEAKNQIEEEIQNSKRFQKDLKDPAKIVEEKMIEQINEVKNQIEEEQQNLTFTFIIRRWDKPKLQQIQFYNGFYNEKTNKYQLKKQTPSNYEQLYEKKQITISIAKKSIKEDEEEHLYQINRKLSQKLARDQYQMNKTKDQKFDNILKRLVLYKSRTQKQLFNHVDSIPLYQNKNNFQLKDQDILKEHFKYIVKKLHQNDIQTIDKMLMKQKQKLRTGLFEFNHRYRELIKQLYILQDGEKDQNLSIHIIRKINKQIKGGKQQDLKKNAENFKKFQQNIQPCKEQNEDINSFIWFISRLNISTSQQLLYLKNFIETQYYKQAKFKGRKEQMMEIDDEIKELCRKMEGLKSESNVEGKYNEVVKYVKQFHRIDKIQDYQIHFTYNQLRKYLKTFLSNLHKKPIKNQPRNRSHRNTIKQKRECFKTRPIQKNSSYKYNYYSYYRYYRLTKVNQQIYQQDQQTTLPNIDQMFDNLVKIHEQYFFMKSKLFKKQANNQQLKKMRRELLQINYQGIKSIILNNKKQQRNQSVKESSKTIIKYIKSIIPDIIIKQQGIKIGDKQLKKIGNILQIGSQGIQSIIPQIKKQQRIYSGKIITRQFPQDQDQKYFQISIINAFGKLCQLYLMKENIHINLGYYDTKALQTLQPQQDIK